MQHYNVVSQSVLEINYVKWINEMDWVNKDFPDTCSIAFCSLFLCWIKPRILPSHHETPYYLLIVCNRVPILCFSGGRLFPMGRLQLLQVSTRWVWRLGRLLWASCLLRLETKWKLKDIILFIPQKNEIQHIRSATIFKWSYFLLVKT